MFRRWLGLAAAIAGIVLCQASLERRAGLVFDEAGGGAAGGGVDGREGRRRGSFVWWCFFVFCFEGGWLRGCAESERPQSHSLSVSPQTTNTNKQTCERGLVEQHRGGGRLLLWLLRLRRGRRREQRQKQQRGGGASVRRHVVAVGGREKEENVRRMQPHASYLCSQRKKRKPGGAARCGRWGGASSNKQIVLKQESVHSQLALFKKLIKIVITTLAQHACYCRERSPPSLHLAHARDQRHASPDRLTLLASLLISSCVKSLSSSAWGGARRCSVKRTCAGVRIARLHAFVAAGADRA